MDTSPAKAADAGRRMAEGTVWVVCMRLAIRTLGVLSTVILARLLMPSDYGLVALAMSLVAAAEMLGSFSFEVWLIRTRDATPDHYNTVWTLSLARGLLTAIALWLLADPIAAFFTEPRLGTVVRIVALGVLIRSAQNVGIVDFQRDMRFSRDFLLNASVKTGAFLVTVGLGFALRNYWALVAGIVASDLLLVSLSYAMHPYRPRLGLRHWREAFTFSRWLLAGNYLSFAYQRADTFILGKVAGSQVLGLYNVAREIANLATSELVMPIRRVMLPGYATLQDDTSALRRSFLDGFGLIMMVGTPVAVGLSLVADPLIRVMLGDRWLDAIPLMQVLAIYGVSSIGMANQWPVLVALGRQRLAVLLVAATLAVLLPAFYVATKAYGAVGAGLALGGANTLLFVAGLEAVRRVIDLEWRAIAGQAWRSLVATAVMGVCVWLGLGWLGDAGAPAVVQLVAASGLGAVAYAGTLFALVRLFGIARGPEWLFVNFVRRRRASD